MSKENELDQFNDDNAVKAVSKPSTSAWESEKEEEGPDEVMCGVCNASFVPVDNLPSLFCKTCKTALKEMVVTHTTEIEIVKKEE